MAKRIGKAGVPAHLGAVGRELWDRVQHDFHVEDAAGRALLMSACEARDRIEGARKAIERDGVVIRDRFGELRQHPACPVEHSARAAMIRALSALRLAPEGDS